MKKKLMWEPSQLSNLKILRIETCSYGKKLITAQHPTQVYTCYILYINLVSLSVSLWWGFWGVGEREVGEAAGDRCQSMTGLDHHGFRTG
jgi:hypothetical protein